MKSVTRLLSIVALLFLTGSLSAQYAPRANYGAKFELEDQVIHCMGQVEEISLAEYAAALPPELFPQVYMAYLPARSDADRLQRARRELGGILEYYPEDMALQIGIPMTSNGRDYSDDIIAGVYDDNLDAAIALLDSFDRDIFVRIGYEANGFWNGYNPADYIAAFRIITDKLRAASDRFSIVWCTHPIDGLDRQLEFYPGDEYVDWWAIDLFETSFINNQATADFLAAAAEREFPVMIGESTPTGVGVGDGQESWDDWFETYFDVIRDNPGVKMFCYINRDWTYVGALPAWGNGLIHTNETVRDLYAAELSNPIYAHLPQTDDHLTAMVGAEAELHLSSAGDAAPTGETFTVGVRNADTLVTYLRFDLDTLLADSIRAVNFWVGGRGSSGQDTELEIVQVEDWGTGTPDYANRPAVIRSLGVTDVNDNRRDKLIGVELTQAVLAARDAGERTIALSFRQTASSAPLTTMHATDREDGYPPRLQVVYAERTTSVGLFTPEVPAVPLSIYPNPTSGDVQLSVELTEYTARVFDVAGRLMWAGKPTSGSLRFSAADWPAGSYTVEVLGVDGRRGLGRLVRL